MFSVAVARLKDQQDSWPSGPVRSQAFRSKRRCLEQASGLHRHTKPGAVEIGKQRAAIRERGARDTSAQFVFGPLVRFCEVAEALGGGGLGAAHALAPTSPERPLRLQFCLELFAGSTSFARALGKRGHYCIAIDIRWGDDHIMVDSRLRATILLDGFRPGSSSSFWQASFVRASRRRAICLVGRHCSGIRRTSPGTRTFARATPRRFALAICLLVDA